jgi:hypothetical protein
LESAKANQGEVTVTTTQSLATIGADARKNGQADIARHAYESIQNISSQSSDPLIKDTAVDSMKAMQLTGQTYDRPK